MFKKIFFLATFVTASLSAMNKEIEYKFSLPEQERCAFKRWLILNGAELKGTFLHEEVYFKEAGEQEFSNNTLRVRTATNIEDNSKKQTICYKERHEHHRDEYETQVTNAQTVTEIFVKKFNATTQCVTKVRTTYVWQKTLEIAFDTVENLGDFVEIEVIKPVDSIEEGVNLIEDIILQAGVTEIVKYSQGYIHMLGNKNMQANKIVIYKK